MNVLIRIWQAWHVRTSVVRKRSDLERAIDLIEALDRGGVVSDPIRVNAIARALGLEVSRRAPITETVERIRAVIVRASNRGYD